MASNSTLVVDDGESHLIAKLSESAIETRAAVDQPRAARYEAANAYSDQREAGDQVNRFLLCVLVSESAKRIKKGGEKAGETLPMTMIVRGVLRSYRLAAKDKHGPLAGPDLDIAGLRMLNEKVLSDELARHSRDRVKTVETRLAHAERLRDDSKIKAEKDSLELAIELRDRLSGRYL
jgi:hypothetical protein